VPEMPQRQANSAEKGKSFKGMSNSVGKSVGMTLLALRKHRAFSKKVFAKLKKRSGIDPSAVRLVWDRALTRP